MKDPFVSDSAIDSPTRESLRNVDGCYNKNLFKTKSFANSRRALQSGAEKISRTFRTVRNTFGNLSQAGRKAQASPSRDWISVQGSIYSCYQEKTVLLGNILIGYALGWSAPVARKLQNIKETPLPYLLTDGEISWAAAVLTLGVIMGANGSGYLSNIIGRKPCLILGGVFLIFGFSFVTAAVNIGSIYTGRLLAGLGVGSIAINNLVYIGEIASTNIRGTLLASTGVMHTVGCLLVFSVGPFVSYYAVGGILVMLSAVFAVGCFFIPESPTFYMIKGENGKAKAVLRKLGRHQDIDKYLNINDDENLILCKESSKIDGIKKEYTRYKQWKWLQLITVKSNKKAFIITVILFIIQQTGGSTAIMFFSTTIFANAASSIEPDVATIILGTIQLLGVLFTPILIEKMGRRTLILISTSGCSICLALMGVHFYLEFIRHPCSLHLGWLPLVLLILNVFFYDTGLSIIPSTLIGEMFSANVRSTGSCISMSIGLIFGFISGVTFGYLVASLGSHVMFWIYSTMNGLGFIFSVLWVPETKGKSLAEIRIMLSK